MNHVPGDGSTQPEPCSSCGAEDWQVEEFGPFKRLLGWMQFGRPAPRARLTCRRCGSQLITHERGRFAIYRARRNQAWWGVPVRIVRVFVNARAAIPSPVIYLGAAVAGSLLGVLLDLGLGWPW